MNQYKNSKISLYISFLNIDLLFPILITLAITSFALSAENLKSKSLITS